MRGEVGDEIAGRNSERVEVVEQFQRVEAAFTGLDLADEALRAVEPLAQCLLTEACVAARLRQRGDEHLVARVVKGRRQASVYFWTENGSPTNTELG